MYLFKVVEEGKNKVILVKIGKISEIKKTFLKQRGESRKHNSKRKVKSVSSVKKTRPVREPG